MSENVNNETSTESLTDMLAASAFANESVATSEPVKEVASETNDANNITTTTAKDSAVGTSEKDVVATETKNELKEHLGFEKWEEAKAQFEELKKLKETASTKEEIKFANEQSKKFFDLLKEGKEDDLYHFLNEKKTIEKLTSIEVNEKTAEEIIKFQLKQKYKDLSEAEIDYKFKKQFGIPKEPVQRLQETDEEFEERISQWKYDVENAKNDLIIEAKTLRPELEKLKSELTLPDISQKEDVQKPSQEELESFARYKDAFIQSIDNTIKEFEGFNVTVKDEEVEIPINYNLSDEEKQNVTAQLKDFAENGFNANALFVQRWTNEDGTINTKQVIKDLALLETEGKAAQKFANDTASKIKLKYIKQISNIHIAPTGGENHTPDDTKDEYQSLAESVWANK